MGRFGERIGSYEAIAANLLFSTLIATTILLLLRQSLAGFGAALHSPWWYWVGGGGMGVVVVLTITVVTPPDRHHGDDRAPDRRTARDGRADRPLRLVRRREGCAHLAAAARRAAAGIGALLALRKG